VNRFRLLVFDWDGTLMDSIGSIVACAHAAAAELGLPAAPEEALRAAIGLGLADTIERLLPGAAPEEAQRMMETYRRHWLATYRHRPRLFPGAAEALAELERAGYLLALATGKGRRGLDLDLAATGLAGRFAATRTADQGLAKPHPRMLLELLDELGAGAAESLMIGDSRWDLEMAAAAGVPAVAVATGTWPREELAGYGPLATLGGVAELPAWLRGGGG
jgi:phosphoglycolate phosphatase